MSSTVKNHPALDLFRRMFEKAEAENTICSPDHFVETSIFMDRLTDEGIDHPEGFIQYADWCEEIGLCAFAHRLITQHCRRTGAEPGDPNRGAAYRFHRRRKLAGLA